MEHTRSRNWPVPVPTSLYISPAQPSYRPHRARRTVWPCVGSRMTGPSASDSLRQPVISKTATREPSQSRPVDMSVSSASCLSASCQDRLSVYPDRPALQTGHWWTRQRSWPALASLPCQWFVTRRWPALSPSGLSSACHWFTIGVVAGLSLARCSLAISTGSSARCH